MKKSVMLLSLFGIQVVLPMFMMYAPKKILSIDDVRPFYKAEDESLILPGDHLDYMDPIVFEQISNEWPSLSKLQISDTSLSEIPATIGLLRNLKYLNLHDWRNLTTLPSTIANLTNLKKLRIYKRRFSKPFILPEATWQLSSLEELITSGLAQDKLPEEIANLHNLKHLILENSQIKSLPESISDMKKLEWINVRNTPLVRLKSWSVIRSTIENNIPEISFDE